MTGERHPTESLFLGNAEGKDPFSGIISCSYLYFRVEILGFFEGCLVDRVGGIFNENTVAVY